MSRFSKMVMDKTKRNDKVTNFMGGVSYNLNPLETLKLVTSSSIFGEPQYYRSGEFADSGIEVFDGIYTTHDLVSSYSIFDKFEGKKTSQIMEQTIDDALDFNFEATLLWAVKLRKEFMMRLNPQVIMVRASIHPKRKAFSEKYPGRFNRINNDIMSRADEPSSQLTYWLYSYGSKNKIPSVLKRSWAKKVESLSIYDIYKYKNKGLGLIDVVRICHANNSFINELMKTGTVTVKANETTWETLRSSGMPWSEIIYTIKLPHMALLRNLRNIFTEISDYETCKSVMETLKKGVLDGKQFPFRYYTAMKYIQNSEVYHKNLILDTFEDCIDISRNNMPKLKGKTMCLSDNSGSAWGCFNSEYGSVTVAEIDNLSSVLTAQNSEEGYVGKFGDGLKVFPISSSKGALLQTNEITENGYNDVGGRTENGIWMFFDQAIKKKEHWDNIFIYSDQQAGHGGLYGLNAKEYAPYSYNSNYIDVMKLIFKYRVEVNKNVNVFSIQTAGYNNVVVPEYSYRTNILYGWTGKEVLFANAIINFWDQNNR